MSSLGLSGGVSESTAGDWLALLKPRVVVLVVFTGWAGLLAAPGHLHPVLAFTAVLCIAVGAGACGAINMWYDRDIDAVMRRTARRPIPSGRIGAGEALGFGIALAAASVLLMWLATNVVAALILAISIGFYVVIYPLWLKRRTPQNIVIGGAAGAFPPLIGWAAVTGGIDWLPVLMFAIVFMWTPPHFWALSLWTHGDYEKAGVPMLPVSAGARSTRWHIMVYTLLLVPVTVAPWALGMSSRIYGVPAALAGAWFIWDAWRVLRDQQDSAGVSLTKDAPAKKLFRYSLYHLAILFTAFIVDAFVG